LGGWVGVGVRVGLRVRLRVRIVGLELRLVVWLGVELGLG
jgi:hypothetical protein